MNELEEKRAKIVEAVRKMRAAQRAYFATRVGLVQARQWEAYVDRLLDDEAALASDAPRQGNLFEEALNADD